MQKANRWEIAGEAAWGVALHREAVVCPLQKTPATVPAAASDLLPYFRGELRQVPADACDVAKSKPLAFDAPRR
jgi:hypothetical protein